MNTFRILSLCTLALAFTVSVKAQDEDRLPYSTLSLRVGAASISSKDEFQSPYTYRGINYRVSTSYENIRPRGRHVVTLDHTGGGIRSVVSPRAGNNLTLLNYDYFFGSGKKYADKKLAPLFGLGVHTLLSRTNYEPTVEQSKTYLTGGVYAAVNSGLVYRLSKKISFELEASLPLAGIVYRPDFEINGKTLQQTTLPGTNLLLSASAKFRYQVNEKVSFTVGYHHNYFTFDKPRPVTILQQGLFIGMIAKF